MINTKIKDSKEGQDAIFKDILLKLGGKIKIRKIYEKW